MDVRVSFDDQVPIVVVSGRFDGFGAECFDQALQGIDTNAPFRVLDVSGVTYLSSLGLRSLVSMEKTLRAGDGGLILAGVTPFVRRVLEVTRLDGWFRAVPAVSDALRMARASAAAGPVTEHHASGRVVRVRSLTGSASRIEWWRPETGNGQAGDGLVSASLGEFGFAVGTGGFGESADDARAALGTVVSTPVFAGVRPADGHGVSDFIAGVAADTVPLHVSTALGVLGTPALVAEISAPDPFGLLDLVDDLFDIAGAEGGSTMPRLLGLVAMGESPEGQGGVLGIGVAYEAQAARLTVDRDGRLLDWPGQIALGSGRSIVGAAVPPLCLGGCLGWTRGSENAERF